MPERPEPDLDHVREAMREHDERSEQEPEEPPPEEPPPDEPADED